MTEKKKLRNFKLLECSNGGWLIEPCGGDFCVYEPIGAYSNTDDMLTALKEMLGVSGSESVEADDMRDEYGPIPPRPKGDGWKRNTGVQPFGDDVFTEVVLRNENPGIARDAEDWGWELFGCYGDIIWYREVKEK